MEKSIVKIVVILIITTFDLLPQSGLEKSYANIKKFSDYLNDVSYQYSGVDAGDKIVDYLREIKGDFTEMDSVYKSFKEQLKTRNQQIEQIERNIRSAEFKLYDLGDYEVIGKRYHGQYTLVYDESNRIFAISGQIPLHVRKSYRLLRTDRNLTIKSSTSFEDYEYRIYTIYNGEFDREINLLKNQKNEKYTQLVSYIESVAKSLQKKITVLKTSVLDSLISSNQSKFKENLNSNKYKDAYKDLEKLQKYLWERESNTKIFESLSIQLYENQFKFILDLIAQEEIQKAEINLVLFKDINWNKIDLQSRSDELYYKLVNKRGEKNFRENRFCESYLEYFILLKAFPNEEYLMKFYNSFSAHTENELNSAFRQKDIKAISSIYDSLSYYENRFPEFKSLSELNVKLRKELAAFMRDITQVDLEASNYYFIPGGEHYLDSEFEQSKMYPFLVLKVPADGYLLRLIDLVAQLDGTIRDRKLTAMGLRFMSNREMEYVKAGGWMSLNEAGKYGGSFFNLTDYDDKVEHFVIKVDELKDQVLADQLSKRSEVERDLINPQVIEIREKNGFKPFARVRFGVTLFGIGYSYLGNLRSYDPERVIDKDELNQLSLQAGVAMYIKLNSDLSPIPEGKIRPAMTYLETSLNYSIGVTDSTTKKPFNIFHRLDLGIGLVFKSQRVATLASPFINIKTGVSASRFDDFKSKVVITPFISFTYTGLEIYLSYDTKAGKLGQISISANLLSSLLLAWDKDSP